MTTFDEYIAKINIQDVLKYAGYTFNRRDGYRYPTYSRTNSDGSRVQGDKFVITSDGKGCFHVNENKVYNVISLITNYPHLFPEHGQTTNPYALVNLVCNKLLGNSSAVSKTPNISPLHSGKSFSSHDYDIIKFQNLDFGTIKKFYPYFKSRGIDINTQRAFSRNFFLSCKKSREGQSGRKYYNLSFPLTIPGKGKGWVGFEERGKPRLDGKSGYKGKSQGSNASEGLWIASPKGVSLESAKDVFWFESAYDAMSYYQLHHQRFPSLSQAVFISTGGTPTVNQCRGVLLSSPKANHWLCFDNDMAGKQFVENFKQTALQTSLSSRGDVSLELRTFVSSFPKTPLSAEDLTNIDDDQYDELPKELKELYRRYDTAREEALEYQSSHYVCNEDKEASREKMQSYYKEFKQALFASLHIEEGKALHPYSITRLLPAEGYKDWNEQLLSSVRDKIENLSKDREEVVESREDVGVDMDNDGEIEVSESDVKKSSNRHFR